MVARFDKAPKKIQKAVTKAAARAGATVIRKAAMSMAPSCIRPSIKVVYRKQIKFKTILSITAGHARGAINENENEILEAAGAKGFGCPPVMWVEFGTYGNRDYKGLEPYSPDTLRKKSYASGRSNSPFWNLQDPGKIAKFWMPQRPFMRPAVSAPGVEKAMAKKLGAYLAKKGF